MKKIFIPLLITITLIVSSAPAFADYDREPAMVADVLLVRPVGLAAIVVGAAVFVVALPFALTSGSVESVAYTLVARPFRYTFIRPLGNFNDAWRPGFGPYADP